jgi:hypothetical protein
MVVHVYNPSTREAKARGSQIWGQHVLHSETLSQKTNQPTNHKTKTKQKTLIINFNKNVQAYKNINDFRWPKNN